MAKIKKLAVEEAIDSISVLLSDLEGFYSTFSAEERTLMLYAAGEFVETKQVYSFDKNFLDELVLTDLDNSINLSLFDFLPYDCIYLDFSLSVFQDFIKESSTSMNVDYKGFLVLKVKNPDSKYGFKLFILPVAEISELNSKGIYTTRLMYILSMLSSSFGSDQSFKDFLNIDYSENSIADKIEKVGKKYTVEDLKSDKYFHELIKLALYSCVYIISKEADVQKVYSPTRPKEVIERKKLSSCEVSHVGYRIGRAIGEERAVYNKVNNSELGFTKSPHIRSAHWHHYWVGPLDSPERHLELRWVRPTFIHSDLGVPSTTVVHKTMDEAIEKQREIAQEKNATLKTSGNSNSKEDR